MNFDQFSRTQNTEFFNHYNPLYDNERKLYDLIVTEVYNLHGISLTYYAVTYNTNYDRIFGEDNDRRVERKFDFMAYMELPQDQKAYSIFGITSTDIVKANVSMRHFEVASTFSLDGPYDDTGISGIYPSISPRAGDFVRLSLNELEDSNRQTRMYEETPNVNDTFRNEKFNNYYYEIISVRKQEVQFLQHQHTWELTMRVYKDKSILLDETNMSKFGDLTEYTNKSDLFDIGKFITSANQEYTNLNDIRYIPKPTECAPKDPFNDWWS